MFNRRLLIFFLVLLAVFGVVSARLIQLQLFAHREYLQRVENVMIYPAVLLPSIRGRIFDRNGKLLAGNTPCFDLAIHYGAMTYDKKYIKRVARSRARYDLGKKYPSDDELEPYVQQVRSQIEERAPVAEVVPVPTVSTGTEPNQVPFDERSGRHQVPLPALLFACRMVPRHAQVVQPHTLVGESVGFVDAVHPR